MSKCRPKRGRIAASLHFFCQWAKADLLPVVSVKLASSLTSAENSALSAVYYQAIVAHFREEIPYWKVSTIKSNPLKHLMKEKKTQNAPHGSIYNMKGCASEFLCLFCRSLLAPPIFPTMHCTVMVLLGNHCLEMLSYPIELQAVLYSDTTWVVDEQLDQPKTPNSEW